MRPIEKMGVTNMKKFALILLVLLFTFSVLYAAGGRNHRHCVDVGRENHFEHTSLEFDDATLILIHNGHRRSRVEITEDYELYVNNRFVETDKKQRKLLKEYYNHALLVVGYAEEIGLEGAEIGIKGAKIGLMAVGGIFSLLREDYDLDDLERELEIEAEKLEARAEELEEQAEELEDIAEELEDISDELADEIPELAELNWF
jgi:hypothetical protein